MSPQTSSVHTHAYIDKIEQHDINGSSVIVVNINQDAIEMMLWKTILSVVIIVLYCNALYNHDSIQNTLQIND